uniref:BACK domain-containing protein n=1 Tax=Panagrellus redivivus TaxID=6233 RepID=A0A7E4UNN4_PANRE
MSYMDNLNQFWVFLAPESTMTSSYITFNGCFNTSETRQIQNYLLGGAGIRNDFIIFEALVSWMRANPDYLDWFPEILKQFDLYLLGEQQLEVLFEPVELVDRNVCLSLLTQQREQAMDVQKVVNENVIDPTGFRLVNC